MAKHFEVSKYDHNPEWNRIDSKGKFADWQIDFCGDGELCINCDDDAGGNRSLYLTPDQTKQLIEFLQEGLDRLDGKINFLFSN